MLAATARVDGVQVGWTLWHSRRRSLWSKHYVVQENVLVRNGVRVADWKDHFNFGSGRSVTAPLAQCAAALQHDLLYGGYSPRPDYSMADLVPPKVVMVGHSPREDLEKLAEMGVVVPEGVEILDTDRIHWAWAQAQAEAWSAQFSSEENVQPAPLALQQQQGGNLSSSAVRTVPPANGTAAQPDGSAAEPGGGTAQTMPTTAAMEAASAAAVAADVSFTPQLWVSPSLPLKPKPVKPPPPSTTNPPAAGGKADSLAAALRPGGVGSSIKLAVLLNQLGISFHRLHNAGNDARYTMEALLAMCGTDDQKPLSGR